MMMALVFKHPGTIDYANMDKIVEQEARRKPRLRCNAEIRK